MNKSLMVLDILRQAGPNVCIGWKLLLYIAKQQLVNCCPLLVLMFSFLNNTWHFQLHDYIEKIPILDHDNYDVIWHSIVIC